MTGVKGFIKSNIPNHWEKALRDNKCLGSFIEQFYQGIAEEKNKNRYCFQITMRRARHLLSYHSLAYIAITLKFKEGESFWEGIDWIAKFYEQLEK